MNAPIRSRWSPQESRGLSGPDLCAYASRLIGAESRLVLWGGGNSSIKTVEKDHAGRDVRTLWVKASGYDMKSISAEGFSPLRLDELVALKSRPGMSDEDMVAYQMRCLMDPKAAKPSIETLLHAFIPAPHVYHTHADAIAGFTCTPRSRERTEQAFGGGVLWVPYIRPGFELSRRVAEAVSASPQAWAMILDKHGALTWGESAEEAYERMIRLVQKALGARPIRGDRGEWSKVRIPSLSSAERAERAARLMPWLRGSVSQFKKMIVRWTDEPAVLRFLERPEAAQITQRGTFTPDHTLQTKSRPLYWRFKNRDSLGKAVNGFADWHRAYFKEHAPKGTDPLDPYPRVILVPGIGMFAAGKDWRAAGIPQEIYRHTIDVISRVCAMTRYTPLDKRHLGEMEFWPLETFKYKLLPPEKEFSRRVVMVTGAAGGIGAATARRFCEAGAHVVLGDLDLHKAARLAGGLNAQLGAMQALAVRLDVCSEKSVEHAFREAVLAYGGLDILFSNAGIAKSAAVVDLKLRDWEDNFRVNATGHFLVSRAALRIMKDQGAGGAIVFNASKNVLAPGKEFAAYSASKAAETQLARVLALEAADHGVRVNVVNPDAVFEGSGLWSTQVRRERARAQGIDPAEIEEHYIRRNLLKAKITGADVAEAVLFLASERCSKTTGAILPVDGGLREAFPR